MPITNSLHSILLNVNFTVFIATYMFCSIFTVQKNVFHILKKLGNGPFLAMLIKKHCHVT